MLKIDRIEIDDAGGNPEKLALSITKQLETENCAVPVREIARAIDVYEIREEGLDGLEGGLIVPEDKSVGAILVHRERPEARKRYTIAHELGHYVNPWHKPPTKDGFRCKSRDMVIDRYDPKDRAMRMEVEANRFAAELLMPSNWVLSFLKSKKDADLSHILEMAKLFFVSKESAARRYIARVEEPAAVVFSKNGVIRYIKRNRQFPKVSVAGGQPLPPECISSISKADIGEATDWHEVAGHIWLQQSRDCTVFEQTIAQRNGFRMTLLSVETADYPDESTEGIPSFTRY